MPAVATRHLQVAKQVASLDHLSEGRFVFGIGAGWNLEEMRNHGIDPARRWQRMREQVLALRTLWTTDVAEFHAELVDFDPLWQWPKPFQRPHPPVLLGGEGPTVLQRVLDYADGWLPNDHPAVHARIEELHRLAAASGQEPPPVTVFAVEHDARVVECHRQAGVQRCVFNLPTAPAGEVLPVLQQLAAFLGPAR